MLNQETLDQVSQERERMKKEFEGSKSAQEGHIQSVKNELAIYEGFKALIDFLQGHKPKVEVLNQIKSLRTPDVADIVSALDDVDTSVKGNKVNLRPLENVLKKIETQLSTLPRVFPEAPEQREDVKVTNLHEINFQELIDAVNSLELNPNIEAPIVKVNNPNPKVDVHVDAPDLDSLKEGLKAIVDAVLDIEYPEIPEFPVKTLEKLLQANNDVLQKILKKPMGGGGGGGGGSSFVLSNGNATYVQVEGDGSIPVTIKNASIPVTTTTPNYLTKIDDTTTPNVIYIGNAVLTGSAVPTSSNVWQIKRLDLSSLALDKKWADGNANFDNVWDNRASLTYN